MVDNDDIIGPEISTGFRNLANERIDSLINEIMTSCSDSITLNGRIYVKNPGGNFISVLPEEAVEDSRVTILRIVKDFINDQIELLNYDIVANVNRSEIEYINKLVRKVELDGCKVQNNQFGKPLVAIQGTLCPIRVADLILRQVITDIGKLRSKSYFRFPLFGTEEFEDGTHIANISLNPILRKVFDTQGFKDMSDMLILRNQSRFQVIITFKHPKVVASDTFFTTYGNKLYMLATPEQQHWHSFSESIQDVSSILKWRKICIGENSALNIFSLPKEVFVQHMGTINTYSTALFAAYNNLMLRDVHELLLHYNPDNYNDFADIHIIDIDSKRNTWEASDEETNEHSEDPYIGTSTTADIVTMSTTTNTSS